MRNELYNFKLTISLAAIIVVIGLWSCRSTKQNLNKPPDSAPPTAPVSQSPFDIVDSKVIAAVSPFDHNRKEHKSKTQDCSACHQRASNEPTPALPGHPACIECHAKDFTNPDSKMCVVCHKAPPTKTSVIEFPTRLAQFGLKRFSHRDHTNPEKMRGQMEAEKMPGGALK